MDLEGEVKQCLLGASESLQLGFDIDIDMNIAILCTGSALARQSTYSMVIIPEKAGDRRAHSYRDRPLFAGTSLEGDLTAGSVAAVRLQDR